MTTMTAWRAECYQCVHVPRYAALARLRESNDNRLINKLTGMHELAVLEICRLQKPGPGRFDDTKVTLRIRCQRCARCFSRTLRELRVGSACRCRAGGMSRGEVAVMSCLQRIGIAFEREVSLSSLGLGTAMRFDFYLPKCRIAIEYDGEQHVRGIARFGGEAGLRATIRRDERKDNLAKQAGITVIRVRHDCPDVDDYLAPLLPVR